MKNTNSDEKKFKMKKKLFKFFITLIFILLSIFLYREYKINSRSHFIGTFTICNNLYAEKFKVFSLSDLYCDYLTDSLNFRVFINTYQDYEAVLYECKGDSVFIRKVYRQDNKIIIEHDVYLLSSLKTS